MNINIRVQLEILIVRFSINANEIHPSLPYEHLILEYI